MHRLRRRRLGLDAMYDVAGNMMDDACSIGREIVRHWGPVFSAVDVDPGLQTDFLDFVQPQTVLVDWSWVRGVGAKTSRECMRQRAAQMGFPTPSGAKPPPPPRQDRSC